MNNKELHKYKNGNYTVTLYEDGTKVREVPEEGCIPEFPENIDIKITNRCDKGCPYCHENSTPEGKQGSFDYDFLWTLREGTELAIGGGNIFEMNDSPDYEEERYSKKLRDFLIWCESRGLVPNLTVNPTHLEIEKRSYGDDRVFEHMNSNLRTLIEFKKRNLFYGLGISFNGNAEEFERIFNYEDRYDREDEKQVRKMIKKETVIHVINGVDSVDEILKLGNKGYKLLILGYKEVRRGCEYKEKHNPEVKKNQEEMYKRIHELRRAFDVVSFDNLAIEQLNVKRMFTEEEWKEFYMGDDGTFTMYIDLVEGEYASSSTSSKRYPIEESIDKMFKKVIEE